MPIFSRSWRDPQTGALDPEQLRLNGPALQVEIAIPSWLATAYQQLSIPLPAPHVGVALLDTGATISAVERSVLDGLGITPHSAIPVATASGLSQQPLYACDISFPGTPIPTLPFNFVVGSQISSLGYAALIGRDVLRYFQLVYNGVEGMWALAF